MSRLPKTWRPLSACLLLCLVTAGCAPRVPRSDLHAESDLDRDRDIYLSKTNPIPHLSQIQSKLRARKLDLSRRVVAREAAGQDAACSHQILAEVLWLSGSTLDFPRLERRLDDLESSLAHPGLESQAREQDPSDGGWGRCQTEWFFKVNSTYDHLETQAGKTETPRYELHLFDRVNSPETLRAYFDGISISDVARTGRENRRELNESLENLGRLILRDKPGYYRWDPGLKAVVMDLILNRLRNPQTGWWGARFRRDGRVDFVDDLSMTFHVATILDGNLPDLAKAMDHLLAVKNLDYEIGWLRHGGYSNHHNMDVVRLFAYGWPQMSDAQKREASAEFRKMLRWCLADSLKPDGSFLTEENNDDSIEEQMYFGVSFLAALGLFDPAKRFWTSEEFPQAEEIRRRIAGYIRTHLATGAAGGNYYESALSKLGAPHPMGN